MSSVKKLPKKLIVHIAAGEVVDRPANIVKELIENSLDANAKNISISIEGNGLKKIEIIDDGVGMSRADMVLAPLLHTTSKIQTKRDLTQIETLGFRGEALASIAHVGRLVVRSRQRHASMGYEIDVVEQVISDPKPLGMPKGTHIIVSDVYSRLPARLKRAQSKKNESSYIARMITHYALANNHVRFLFRSSGKIIIDVQPSSSIFERASVFYGEEFSSMIPVKLDLKNFKVKGFMGMPSITYPTTDKQLIIVNSRPVNFSYLSREIKVMYGKSIENGRYPVFLLDFTIPVRNVDVNIHPKKEEVKVLDEQDVVATFSKEIAPLLHNPDSVTPGLRVKDAGSDSYLADYMKKKLTGWSVRKFTKKASDVFQLDKLYLVYVAEDEILIMDQHAAHERILYEEFKSMFLKELSVSDVHRLSQPIVMGVDRIEKEKVEDAAIALHTYGFELEEFGSHAYKITQIPSMFQGRNKHELTQLIKDFALRYGEIDRSGAKRDASKLSKINLSRSHSSSSDASKQDVSEAMFLDAKSDATITFMSCRGAVKAGDVIQPYEARLLLKKLLACDQPMTCPHGRPTIVSISKQKLDSMFKR